LRRLVVDGASGVIASTLHSLCFTVLGKGEVLEVTRLAGDVIKDAIEKSRAQPAR
jgi:hypothetical protein